jgi:hypothetical protein
VATLEDGRCSNVVFVFIRLRQERMILTNI